MLGVGVVAVVGVGRVLVLVGVGVWVVCPPHPSRANSPRTSSSPPAERLARVRIFCSFLPGPCAWRATQNVARRTLPVSGSGDSGEGMDELGHDKPADDPDEHDKGDNRSQRGGLDLPPLDQQL